MSREFLLSSEDILADVQVCLSDFEQEEECRILNCRHVFHKECVDQWIKVGRNACPACRTEGELAEYWTCQANEVAVDKAPKADSTTGQTEEPVAPTAQNVL
jgi:hypothetical protein